MKIVWIQRYPTDKPTPIVLTDEQADKYVEEKRDEYCYTCGKVWVDCELPRG